MLARSGYRTVSRLPRLRHMFRAMSLPAIVLNQVEADFVNYLDQFAQTRDPPVECRIAGGWVRDKVSRYELGAAEARSASVPPII